MERKESKAYRETSNKSSTLKLEIMKKTILVLGVVLLGFNMQSRAQEMLSKADNERMMIAIKRDFPELVYKEKTIVPLKDMSTKKGKKDLYTGGFTAHIRGEKRTISANYDGDFNLLTAIVQRQNFVPNPEIRNAIYIAYPDWIIAKNSYRAIYKEDGKRVERFKFTLTKGEEKLIVHTDIHGNFLKPPKTKKV